MGPRHRGVYGRKAGSLPDFAYSPALKSSNIVWDEETLDKWLTNPQTQIRWGEDYIQGRYGTPCQAWAFWQARKYYGPLLAVVPF